MLLSITEGDDKPKKYPLMFRESNLLLLNKVDLLSMVDFDIGKAKQEAMEINPKIEIFEVSCKTGEGILDWVAWIEKFYKQCR
jgi:hydrogenase nickel incorporation protein HypB